MWIRLRQICLVARALGPATADLGVVFGLEPCHRDPAVGKYGLENVLLPIGNQFLEIVAPTRPGTAAERYLDRRGGDGGYMVINQVDQLGPRQARAEALGVRIAARLDYGDFQGMQLHPADTGGAFFEMDFQAGNQASDGPWHPAGDDWRDHVRTGRVTAIRAAELQSPAPDRLARRWADLAELPLTRNAAGHPEMTFENATVRFVPATDGRGEGLGGIDLATADRGAVLAAAAQRGLPVAGDTVTICGTRFRLVA